MITIVIRKIGGECRASVFIDNEAYELTTPVATEANAVKAVAKWIAGGCPSIDENDKLSNLIDGLKGPLERLNESIDQLKSTYDNTQPNQEAA
jgi:hypothetical protein